MNTIFNILGVARYERKLLLRTPKFRILGGIGMAIPIIVGGVLAVLEANGIEFESTVGLGAFVPFYIYSYLQTVVIAFIVGDFRAADERAGVYEVVGARPISTAELVMGKYLGVVGALVTLSLGVLLVTLAIQAAKISITGNPFTLKPYLTYLLLMNLPALIYMSALTFCLGAMLRRQTAVTLITIAYALAVLFFLGRRYGGIYDFGAFFAPLFYSDLMGLGDIRRVVDQRLVYLALALALFGLSIDRYPRLPQSAGWTWFGRGVVVVGLASAAGLYFTMEQQDRGREAFRQAILEEQSRYAAVPVPDVVHTTLDLNLIADGAPLQGTARLRLKNPHGAALDTLIFTLNPGLALRSVQGEAGEELVWKREGAVVRVAQVLMPSAETEVTLAYGGEIDRDGFDLLRTRSRRRLNKRRGMGRHAIKGDLTAWIRPESVFLPPRSLWYPAPGVAYGHKDGRAASFSTAEIALSYPAGLEVITQGTPSEREQAGQRERRVWKVEQPVPVFSLNAGIYDLFETRIDSIDFAFYVHPSHRRQADFFADTKEEVHQALEQIVDAMEQESGLAYPYPKLSVVEVPFLVQWYYEGWEETGRLAEPGVLMVEEDVLMGYRFNRDLKRQMKRQRGKEDPARVKKDLFLKAVFGVFLQTEGSRSGLFRSPVAQLWSFDKTFQGEHHSLLKRGLPLHMQEGLSSGLRQSVFSRGRGGKGRFSRFRRPTQRGSSASWDTLMAKMKQRSFDDLNPAEEADFYRAVVDAKGPMLFRMVESVLGEETYRDVLMEFEEDNRYRDVSFASFEKAAVGDSSKGAARANLQRLVHDAIYSTHVPGYTLTRVSASKFDDGWGSVIYQVIVRIKNGEPGRGFVQVTATGRSDEAVKGVEIEGGQEVEVAMILWERPFRVRVEPFFSRNRRPLMSPVRIPEQVVEGSAKSYVREVAEEDVSFTEIVVDNDDPGFSMPIRRVKRYLRPELKGDNWEERPMRMSFGRYETNYRRKRAGDGSQPAVWTATLPHAGEYDVAFYFINSWMVKRERLAGAFTLRVFHGGQVDTLTLKSSDLQAGWNPLGRYPFKEGEEVSVELSDLADGRLYADAVRWRYVDPNRPEDRYEEMPVFGGFGNRRGGDRRRSGGGDFGF